MDPNQVYAGNSNLRTPAGEILRTPVVSQLPAVQGNANALPAAAVLQTGTNTVSPVSAVASAPVVSSLSVLGNQIVFSATNGGGSAANYKMFDAYGLLASVGNLSATAMTYVDSNRTAAFNEESKNSPYIFSGFSIQATQNASSLAGNLLFYTMSASGALQITPFGLSSASRNTAFNPNLLTFQFDQNFTALPTVACVFSIPAGETITFTWFVVAQANRLF